MVKFIKPSRVCLVLQGRHAGQKVVIVKNYDEGTEQRPYPHAVVAGVERCPRAITKGMGKKKVARRSKVKPFIKTVNLNHLMPTRYNLDLELKNVVSLESFKETSLRQTTKKAVKKLFEERYNSGKNKWFFSKLRMSFLLPSIDQLRKHWNMKTYS
jgi:large subunit ribosomal protein L27e